MGRLESIQLNRGIPLQPQIHLMKPERRQAAHPSVVVATIGNKDNDGPARPGHAVNFSQCLPWLEQMLKNKFGTHQIECTGAKGKIRTFGLDPAPSQSS